MSHDDHIDAMPTISSIAEWFRRAKPEQTVEDPYVQMGCHFEEVSEMLTVLSATRTGIQQGRALTLIEAANVRIRELSEDMKQNPSHYLVREVDRVEMLDALCDQIVTAVGTGVFLDTSIEEALDHVNKSNWSKFVDGKAVFNEQRKIMKGPNYFKPDLTIYI